MVSTLTFEDAVAAYTATLNTPAGVALRREHDDPRSELLSFLDADIDDGEVTLSADVRIILVAADFGRELTTAVLWLNSFDRMDIRCVRLRPYEIDGAQLIDVEQVIPLPEATEFQVRQKRKVIEQERATTDNRDWSRYIITVNGEDRPDENKRNSVRVMIEELAKAGVDPAQIAAALPRRAMREVPGEHQTRIELETALAAIGERPRYYFLDHPLVVGHRTWAISLRWGARTEEHLAHLATAFPEAGVGFRKAT
jgi:hypothetical protein